MTPYYNNSIFPEKKKRDFSGFSEAVRDVRNFSRHVKIYSETSNFSPYDYQYGLLKRYQNNKRVIVRSSRMSGVTIMNCIYALWYAMYHPRKNVVISSSDHRCATTMIKMIQDMYSSLNLMKPGVLKSNVTEISFETGSSILAKAPTYDSFRGMTINLFICDNFAFVKSPKEILDCVYPSLNCTDGTIILSSCRKPNSVTLFDAIFEEAKNKTNDYIMFDIKGSQVPGRDIELESRMVESIGWSNFKQEFNY